MSPAAFSTKPLGETQSVGHNEAEFILNTKKQPLKPQRDHDLAPRSIWKSCNQTLQIIRQMCHSVGLCVLTHRAPKVGFKKKKKYNEQIENQVIWRQMCTVSTQLHTNCTTGILSDSEVGLLASPQMDFLYWVQQQSLSVPLRAKSRINQLQIARLRTWPVMLINLCRLLSITKPFLTFCGLLVPENNKL